MWAVAVTRHRQPTVARATAIAITLAAMLVAAVPAMAADPTGEPQRASCQDRFPADGPGGVDLQLGCLAAEIVAHYTGTAAPTDVTPLSAYLPQIATLGALGAALVVLALVTRSAVRRRLAPVLPAVWWSCGACHSVNQAGTEHCYRCGAARSPDAPTLRTVEHPETPQAFGHDWRDD